jgi:hypothetical protein
VHDGVGFERLQLFEGTMEGSLDAGAMAGEMVELILEVVVRQEILVSGAGAELGFHVAVTS